MEIQVFSTNEDLLCGKCSSRLTHSEKSHKDDDGQVYQVKCLHCAHRFYVQFEDEESREITGDGQEGDEEG